MKFAYAWTFAGQPRDETPAPPPGKPAPVLPRLPAAPCSAKPACSAKQASASSAPCLRSSAPHVASISRLANRSLAQAFHASLPSQNGTTAACHTRLHRSRYALEIWIGQRLSHGARRLARGGRIGRHPNRLVSACWRVSESGSDFSISGLRHDAALPGTRRQPLPPSPAPPARTERCSTLPTSRHRPLPIHCRAPPAPMPARKP